MSGEVHETPCLDPETVAAFAEGRLRRRQIGHVVAHLQQCKECLLDVQAAKDAMALAEPAEQEDAGALRWRWIAIAAAVLIVLVAIPLLWRGTWHSRDTTARLVALASTDARPVESRTTGGFAWAPYVGPMRAGESESDPRKLQLNGIAGDAVARAEKDDSADAQHDAGIALLIVERPLVAIARLRAAVTQSPDEAAIWNDLAAAQHAAGLEQEALTSVERALQLDAHMREALFNRAVILERMRRRDDARAAWDEYLKVDSATPWAKEAQRRRSGL